MKKTRETRSQQSLVAETFSKKAQTYYQGYFGNSNEAYRFTIRRKIVCELLESYRGGKVLDVGCGPGIMVDYLVNKDFEFFGVDISKEVINECENKFGDFSRAHFSVGKVENIEFPDSFFDVVICMGVVEFVDNDDIAIREMARVLKPGGTIIISLPNKVSPSRIWDRHVAGPSKNLINKVFRRHIREAIHQRTYSERAYSQLLASHQLLVTDVIYYNFKVIFYPVDLLSGLTSFVIRNLEFLSRSKLRWVCTGFVVKAKKG